MDCSLPGSSVHGILQAKILEWVAMPFSRGSSRQQSNLCLLQILHCRMILYCWATGEAPSRLRHMSLTLPSWPPTSILDSSVGNTNAILVFLLHDVGLEGRGTEKKISNNWRNAPWIYFLEHNEGPKHALLFSRTHLWKCRLLGHPEFWIKTLRSVLPKYHLS